MEIFNTTSEGPSSFNKVPRSGSVSTLSSISEFSHLSRSGGINSTVTATLELNISNKSEIKLVTFVSRTNCGSLLSSKSSIENRFVRDNPPTSWVIACVHRLLRRDIFKDYLSVHNIKYETHKVYKHKKLKLYRVDINGVSLTSPLENFEENYEPQFVLETNVTNLISDLFEIFNSRVRVTVEFMPPDLDKLDSEIDDNEETDIDPETFLKQLGPAEVVLKISICDTPDDNVYSMRPLFPGENEGDDPTIFKPWLKSGSCFYEKKWCCSC